MCPSTLPALLALVLVAALVPARAAPAPPAGPMDVWVVSMPPEATAASAQVSVQP